MATTVTSPQISMSMQANLDAGAAPAPVKVNVQHQVAELPVVGSGAGQVNKVYSAPFTVTSGAPFTLDLTAAPDPAGGAAMNFTQVHGWLLENQSTTAGQDMTPGG